MEALSEYVLLIWVLLCQGPLLQTMGEWQSPPGLSPNVDGL